MTTSPAISEVLFPSSSSSSSPSDPPLPVHTPHKPHVCEVILSFPLSSPAHPLQICKKSFKRPQDLKKHEKIHTEEHHVQHKHSKAITVNDPAYVSRVRGVPLPHKGALNKSLSIKPSAAPHPPPSLHRIGPSTASVPHGPPSPPLPSLSPDPSLAASPYPSPDSEQQVLPARHVASAAYDLFLQNQVPSWDAHRPQPVPNPRNKRSHDHAVDDFFADVKKRKVVPSYDPRAFPFSLLISPLILSTEMAERLNDIAYAHEVTHYDFNPRSVSFDVRTPEELAAVNEFLVALGRDVTGSVHRAPHTDRFSPSSYFDPDSLNQLGLAGMPGLPPSQSFSHDPAYPSHQYPSATYPSPPLSLPRSAHHSQYSSPYSSIPTNPAYSTDHITPHNRTVSPSASHDFSHSSYAPSVYPSSSPQTHLRPTPPLDPTSPHSSSSTPSNATPPHHSSLSDSFAQFDCVRVPRGAPPPLQLAAPDYFKKPVHTMMNPLKTAPLTVPDLPKPNLRTDSYRGPPAILAPLASASNTCSSLASSSSLYPPLLPEDSDLKPDAGPLRLPPITEMYRSPSPVSAPLSPDTSRGTTPSSTRSSPVPPYKTLSNIQSITKSLENDELVSKVDKIELAHLHKDSSLEERRRHAEFIRYLLVNINQDYKKRFGSPKPDSPNSFTRSLPVDVEMAAA